MIYTTLNRIRAHAPCAEGWKKLLNHLGKTRAADEPLALVTVLDSNGVDDALWCLRAEPQHAAIWRLLAVHYARQVQHLTADQRSLNALDVAERHAHGLATDAELEAARVAAWDAARDAAWDAAWAAARAAAWDAASASAGDAVRDAAWDAASASALASASASAGDAVRDAASASALASAGDAAHKKQADDLRTVLTHHHAEPGKYIHGWGETK